MRPLRLALWAFACCGCSLIWDDTAPEIPLLGAPPDISLLPRLNESPVGNQAFIERSPSDWWLMMEERNGFIHTLRLSEPVQQEFIRGRLLAVARSTFYYDAIEGGNQVVVRRWASNQGYAVPTKQGTLVPSQDGASSAWVDQVLIADGRMLQQPAQVAKPFRNNLLFSLDDQQLIVRAPNNLITVFMVSTGQSIVLGNYSGKLIVDPLGNLLVFSSAMVVRVPLDGSPPALLDVAPNPEFGLFDFPDLIYSAGGEIRRHSLYDDTPPRILQSGAARVLGFYSDGTVVYSRDSATHYIYGAGDGWLGKWHFMERGFFAGLSRDRARAYWIDHAATAGGSGELMSASIGGTPNLLGRNVHQVSELPDGRLLAVANRALLGPQNRIIVIDEAAGTARWVADRARAFRFVPDSPQEILVDIVIENSGHDVVRMAIPPR